MMTRVLDESILGCAMDNLGSALDYAVNVLNIGGQDFLDLFVVTGVAEEFGNGNYIYTTGMSGKKLADEVIRLSGKSCNIPEGEVNGDYSCEYWCGWILAFYQFHSGLTYKKILSVISYEMLEQSYSVLHEAPETKAADVFDGIIRSESFLARMRKKRGLTQAELSKKANISLRSVQLYEQRINDIGRAQYNNLAAMARVLSCEIEDLLED